MRPRLQFIFGFRDGNEPLGCAIFKRTWEKLRPGSTFCLRTMVEILQPDEGATPTDHKKSPTCTQVPAREQVNCGEKLAQQVVILMTCMCDFMTYICGFYTILCN